MSELQKPNTTFGEASNQMKVVGFFVLLNLSEFPLHVKRDLK